MLCHVLKPTPKLCILQLKPGEVLKLSFSAWETLSASLCNFISAMRCQWHCFPLKPGPFSHYSNESKESESVSLRSVPCSQRMTFLPVLVNAGALVARRIDCYQPETEESSVQKENRKCPAQAVWFFSPVTT